MNRSSSIYCQPFSNITSCGVLDHFTFTGKERDEETGYGYFGARYMDHELMTMWLSVDPMADKYPSISPYAYCAWTRPTGGDEHRLIKSNLVNNPVKLVDPEGKDLVKVTVPQSKDKTQEIIVDSKIADKVYSFANAMFEKYGVVVTSSFRSKTRQAELRAAWGLSLAMKGKFLSHTHNHPGKSSEFSGGDINFYNCVTKYVQDAAGSDFVPIFRLFILIDQKIGGKYYDYKVN